MGVKAVLLETMENLANMLFMLSRVIRIDKDVVQIDSYINVKKVTEDVIHKSLEGSRGIA